VILKEKLNKHRKFFPHDYEGIVIKIPFDIIEIKSNDIIKYKQNGNHVRRKK
jgi:hypothetical protein